MTSYDIASESRAALVELNLRYEIGRVERVRVGCGQRGHVFFARLQVQVLIRIVGEPLNVVEALRCVAILRRLAANLLAVYVVNVEHARFVHTSVCFDPRDTVHN